MRRFAYFIPVVFIATLAAAIVATVRADDLPRTVDIVGSIDGDTIETVETGLDGIKPGDSIDVRIDSGGGSVFAGLRVIELLRQSGAHTTCRVGGAALSMAAVILESPACETRVVRPWSIIMFHRVVAPTAPGADSAKLEELLRTSHVLDQALAGIVSTRVGWSPETYLHITAHEFWLTGTDAVKARFADKEQP